MNDYGGKIIAVVGGSGTGKSSLSKKLAGHYGVNVFSEGEEEDFPEEVLESFKTGEGLYNTLIWFRNKQVSEYLEALELKREGNIVLMDTFWMTYQLHINPYLEDGFDKDNLINMSKIDRKLLPWPDVVIYIRSNTETMLEYMKKRDRDWEGNQEFIDLMIALNDEHEKFFSENEVNNLIVVERKDTDFYREEDFNRLVNEIDSLI